MEFRIADTFTDSLKRLTSQEQKAVKTTAFDLQLNPAQPGMQFHRLEQTKDPNFWSVRVNLDIRIIIHKTEASLLLCYVDHHDAAYAWATRRKIERHPTTGAAQLVEVRERVEEVFSYTQATPAPAPRKPQLFVSMPDATLLSYGVPIEWLADVRRVDEDSLFSVVEHLPQEAGEALLELAVGNVPRVPTPISADSDPFAHPDAQRRFRVLQNVEELEQALAFPWEKWTVFLHPAQRHLVERDYSGPARISGSAGTGKTIVALHRVVYLARQHPTAQVVLLTFSDALANALNHKLLRLVGNQPQIRERIGIHATKELAQDLYTAAFGQPTLATPEQVRLLLREAATAVQGQRFNEQFLLNEWTEVVDVWQLDSWERYRDVPRLGRKTRVGSRQREALWAIFGAVQAELERQRLLTWPMLLRRVTEHLVVKGERPFDFAIVDEAQDLNVAELRFLSSLGNRRPDSLFFTGDLGQRIFQQAFSWKAVGVDVRGRSHTLTINYRTSHQIRQQADRLLPPALSDVDGNSEERRGTISSFNGPAPRIATFADEDDEIQTVGSWIAERLAEGVQPEEIGVFVRSETQLARALAAIQLAGARPAPLDEQVIAADGCIAVSTMHLAKGLEFRAVVVMACDDEVIPLQERIESVTDESDLEEIYSTERHLLYVACTRAGSTAGDRR
jgi:mRNA-degrading endonuclease RelE of RelBE toxin-antitoxin system